MKLSKLIRELSVARDNLKVDPEVEVYTHVRTENQLILLEYTGLLKSVGYRNDPDNIRLIYE